ncbi:MAG: CBS domain-containing protein [Deltaproteobacteria bacterium]|nr:CBS domain-containing protein [Deltaproteobacteria bacterium]MDZ4345979.1 CBS domain-containing protein [Candidatus Binatia bacterium]
MLSNKVSEIVTTNLTTAQVSTSIFDVMQLMVSQNVGRVIITDQEVPVGIFTEKDVLRRVVITKVDAKQTAIKEVMTAPIRGVREETHIVDAFAQMYRGKYRHLLVRGDSGKIVGIVSMRRILKLAVELGRGMSETKTMASITSEAAATVDQSLSVYQTIDLMNKNGASAVVVTAEGKATGIFTERDVLKRVATKEISTKDTPVKEVMTAPLITMPHNTLVGDVLAEMYRRDIRNVPVSGDNGELIGIVSMPDILQYAQAFDIDEKVRQTWKEVKEHYDSEDHFTPG